MIKSTPQTQRAIDLQGAEKAYLLLQYVDLFQTPGMNPCASSDPDPDIQKPDTIASRCERHLVTCQPNIYFKK